MLNPYARAAESAALEEDGVGLVCVMYRELRKSLNRAEVAVACGDHFARAGQVSRAITILGELARSLNAGAAPELAGRLEELYGFLTRRVVELNAKPAEGGFAALTEVVASLEEAWQRVHLREAEPASRLAGAAAGSGIATLSVRA